MRAELRHADKGGPGPRGGGAGKPAPGMAVSHIEESLAAGEKLVDRFRLHWFAWFPMFLWIIVGFVTLGLAWWLALYEYLRLKMMENGVTNRRVMLAKGILHRSVQEMALQSIETVEVLQGSLGRRLGFGSVRITDGGAKDLVLRDVEDPGSVKRRLEDARGAAE